METNAVITHLHTQATEAWCQCTEHIGFVYYRHMFAGIPSAHTDTSEGPETPF